MLGIRAFMIHINKTIKTRRPIVVLAVTNDVATDHRVHKIAQSLTQMGFDVRIAGRKRSYSLPVNCPGVSVKRFKLWFNKGPLFYANYNLRLFFHLLFTRYHVLVANDLDTLLACYLAAKIKRKPVVYDSHEYFTEVPELINRPRIQRVWRKIEKSIVPKLTHCYTVSPGIADLYHQKYHTRFKLVRNFPSNTLNRPSLTDYKPPFPTDMPIILYQGAVNLGRGVEEAILAMKNLENVRLVIVGDGDKYDTCRQLAIDEQLCDKVLFTGRVSPDELALITPFATIGLSIEKDMGLNYRFAMPNKLFNYIQAGVPVLASSLPEIKNIVSSYNTGLLINETTPKTISAGIQHMLNSPADIEKWKAGCLKAGKILCWENEEKTLKSIYSAFLPDSF